MNGFVPKGLKPKFEVTTSVTRHQEPIRHTEGEDTSWMLKAPRKFLDETKGSEIPNNQDLSLLKNKKPSISANVIIKSSYNNSKSTVKSFDSSFQSSSNNSVPIDDDDDDDDDIYSQESSNTVDDFTNISIEKTPRLNTTKKPGQVRYAFNLSPNVDDTVAHPSSIRTSAADNCKAKSIATNASAMISYKEKNALLMNKENISTEVDDNEEEDFAIIDESTYADKHDWEEGSDNTLDPSVVKPGEFYTDYMDKSARSFKPPSLSVSELDVVESQEHLSQHRKDSLKPTIFAKSRSNAPTTADKPGFVQTSWISVGTDNAADISSRHSFVQVAHSKGAKSERVHCTVIRDKRATIQGKLSPSYVLILEDTNKPIIVAQKLSLTRTSNYHLFDMTRAQLSKVLSKKSGNYLGKLRATNVNRTEYVLLNQNSEREEIAGIKFDRLTLMDQLKDGNQPRKLKAILPLLDKDRVPIPNKIHDSNRSGSLSEKMLKYESTSAEIDALVFESKDPVFENGNFRLNFSGRVHMPSVKNFQLVSKSNISDVICQFGKVDEDIFHLDFKAPMNACQAFSLALCQFNL